MKHQPSFIQTVVFGTLLWVGVTVTAMSSELARVTGTVFHSQCSTLPANALVYVTLIDVSPRQDVSESIVARQIFTNLSELPFSFELEYDPGRIQESHLYAIQVQITQEGRVIFRNDSAHPVLTQGYPSTVEVTVR